MPLQNGKLTAHERQAAAVFAETGSQAAVMQKTGYAQPHASRALARPAVQAEVLRIQQERLENELLPLAINCLRSIIISDKAPAGARVQAAKVVMDRTLGKDQANDGKEPHEWTAGRLAEEIDRLEQIAAARAKPIEVTVDPLDVFG